MSRVLVLAALIAAGCAAPDPAAPTRSTVLEGTPSSVDSVVLLWGTSELSNCATAGVALSSRHFLFASSCVDETVLNVVVGSPPTPYPIVQSFDGLPLDTAGGGAVPLAILVTASDVPGVTAAALAEAAPELGDELTLVGYSDPGTGRLGAMPTLTEGSVEVVDASAGARSFVFEGIGDVRACHTDSVLFDSAGALGGIGVAGSVEPGTECFSNSVALATAGERAWIDEALAMRIPDATPGPDAGGALDAGAPPAVDAGATVLDAGSTGDSDGGCAVARGSTNSLGWLALLVLGLLWARRSTPKPMVVAATVALLLAGCDGDTTTDAGPSGSDSGSGVLDAGGVDAAALDAGPLGGNGDCTSGPEMELLALLNADRTAMGLTPMSCDPAIAAVAQAHADDMCANDYFDQFGLDGRSAAERLDDAGITYTDTETFIALGQRTPAELHTTLVDAGSPYTDAFFSTGFGRFGLGFAACAGMPRWVEALAD